MSIDRNTLKTFWLLIMSGLFVQGACASHDWSPLDGAALRMRKPTLLVEVLDQTPTLTGLTVVPMTPVLAVITVHGGTDPAGYVLDSLSHSLTSAFNLHVRLRIVSDADMPNSDFDFRDADLALRVRTVEWSLRTSGFYRPRYTALLHMRVSLLDTRTRAVLAQGDCQDEEPKKEDAPTYEQLMADSGAVLEHQIRKASDLCLDYFSRCLFSIVDPSVGGALSCPQPGHYPGEPPPNHQSVPRRH